MHSKQLKVPAFLQGYARCFWTLETDEVDDLTKSFRTLADGCPGLIFQQPGEGVLYQNDKALPSVFLYGQATTHADLRVKGRFRAVGVFFYPNALQTIFGLDAHELTDTCIDVDTLSKHSTLSAELSGFTSINDLVLHLAQYLYKQIASHQQYADEAITYAVKTIVAAQGMVTIPELRAQLFLSERTFERRFKQSVGITPKLFIRIIRFQAALQQMRTQGYAKLSDVAFGYEYADQSHFIRAFKEFAGFSPFQFQKVTSEVMENLSKVAS
ncbi:helix-turn-helix protein [Chitinophaga skermanii]|uniref:Helix-turn-helix protein n=1 Tax=Chitinophaga skermanii TaxID=331697 RepID=A0A327QM02_9BACT|nr:helix-turn-helix transcriptional regulator [Chitinophaga skermanii]RAJ05360.1 helix-turn-helix protein [Chitinophaga skermanii]